MAMLGNGFYKVTCPVRSEGETTLQIIEMIVRNGGAFLVITWHSNEKGERVQPEYVVSLPTHALQPSASPDHDFVLHGFLDLDQGALEVVDHPISDHPTLSPPEAE